MKSALFAFLLALLALAAAPSWAATGADFYVATVPVEDQSEGARTRAAREGLATVLIKLTGSRTLEGDPRVQAMLEEVATYLVEYSYVTLPSGPTGDPGGLGVRIQYDRERIGQTLRAERLPIWPLSRPVLLLWLVVDDPVAGPQPLNGDETVAVLNQAFARRGLTSVHPLYDLEDQLALDPTQIRDFDSEAIASASGRYPVQGWLVVRVYETSSGQWRAAWMMDVAGQSLLRQVQAESLEALLGEMVDQAADSLASRYAYVAGDSAGNIELEISGVESYRDYSRLMALLEGQPMVRQVHILAVEEDRLRLRLGVEGGRDQLRDSLLRGGSLEVVPQNRPAISNADFLSGAPLPEVKQVERLRWLSGR
ncbi:MAG: DUF2066 domain-containing protein [Porticoccaceae bacterium]|nr:DUF2066 domain-containing protein [Porticoccaceae bacterium]